MKEDEIITSYRQAKNRKQQVTILSQLNSITIEQTVDIICSRGEFNRKDFRKIIAAAEKRRKILEDLSKRRLKNGETAQGQELPA